jgi:hypothetical protein
LFIGLNPIQLDNGVQIMYDTFFLTATLERAVKTFAQTLLATVGADSAGVLTATTADAAKVAAGAAILSILTSFASSATGRSGPSLAGETTEPNQTILPTSVVVTQAPKTTTSGAKVTASIKPVTPVAKPAVKKTASTTPAKKTTAAPAKKAPAKKTAPAKKAAPKKP